MRHDSWGFSFDGLGGLGEKSYRQKFARHAGTQNWHETGPHESPGYFERGFRARNVEAKPFVTTRGRQNNYFGSKRPISGSTFSADFVKNLGAPNKRETPIYLRQARRWLPPLAAGCTCIVGLGAARCASDSGSSVKG